LNLVRPKYNTTGKLTNKVDIMRHAMRPTQTSAIILALREKRGAHKGSSPVASLQTRSKKKTRRSSADGGRKEVAKKVSGKRHRRMYKPSSKRRSFEQISSDAAVIDAQIKLFEEACARDMGQRSSASDAAVKDVQT